MYLVQDEDGSSRLLLVERFSPVFVARA